MSPDAVQIRWALEEVSGPLAESGRRFVELFRRGDVSVELYAPRGEDKQTPHQQDEIYIIATGSGTFERDGERVPFATGDVLFVAAHVPHRFVQFTPDFSTWVVFFGPSSA